MFTTSSLPSIRSSRITIADSAPRVLIRTGGGKTAGLGHVRRCLTLGQSLRALGAKVRFLVHGDPEACDVVGREGFAATLVQEEGEDAAATRDVARRTGANLVVLDSYDFSSAYVRQLRAPDLRAVAIDDLADRELDVDLLVNGAAGAERLAYRVPAGTQCLLGPKYALLRPEFAEPPSRTITPEVRRVLVTVGGSDPHRLSARLSRIAAEYLERPDICVVAGPLFDDIEALRGVLQCLSASCSILRDPPDMRSLMLASDLALSAGGQTTYELAATGTPTIAVRTAGNQTGNLAGLSAACALVWAADVWQSEFDDLVARQILELARSPDRRRELSARGRAVVDGGGTARVARAICALARKGGAPA